MITFRCPCGKTYKVEDKFSGRTTKCQQCGQAITVPASSVHEQAKPAEMPATRPASQRPTVISAASRTETARKEKRQPRFLVASLLATIFLVIGVSAVLVMMERSKTATANKKTAEMKIRADSAQQQANEAANQVAELETELKQYQIDPNAMPADFRKKMDEIEKEIKEQGGFAVAGQVVDENNVPLTDGTFTVALKYNESRATDTYRFDRGWFITRRQTDEQYDQLVVATFHHIEQEIPLKIEEGKVITRNIALERVPQEKLVTLSGIIRNEDGSPIPNIQCQIALSRSNGYFHRQATMNVVSDTNGCYSFKNIAFQEYNFSVSVTENYMGLYVRLAPNEELRRFEVVSNYNSGRDSIWWNSEIMNITLPYPKQVTFDVIYQPDGSTDFTKDNVKKGQFVLSTSGSGTANWGNPTGHYILMSATQSYGHDFYFGLRDEQVIFDWSHTSGMKGWYDLGALDFDSVTEVEPDKITRTSIPCKVNHVYGIRTYETSDTGNYAKLIIRKIETVTPEGSKEYSEYESVNLIPGESEPQQAPRNFLAKLKEIETEIKEQGGFAVVGQVLDEDKKPLAKETFVVALQRGNDDFGAKNTSRFDKGWFITERLSDEQYNKLIIATFQHFEQEIPLKIEDKKVVKRNYVLEQVPRKKLASLSGTIRNEEGKPVPNARCVLELRRSNRFMGQEAEISTTSDAQGRYSFIDLPMQEYYFSADYENYCGTYEWIIPDDSQKQFVRKGQYYTSNPAQCDNDELNAILRYGRNITFDIVYQPDGSTSFTNDNIKTGRFTLTTFQGAVSKKGANWDDPTGVFISLDPDDSSSNFNFSLNKGDIVLQLRSGSSGSNPGAYDLGEVDFDSVKEAEPDKIKDRVPCELNHVYVIRTYKSKAPGKYAKIIIRNIEIVK